MGEFKAKSKVKSILAKIAVCVLAVAATVAAMFGIGYRRGKLSEAEKYTFVQCNATFTDTVTGEVYEVMGNNFRTVHIPYDGEQHSFVFQPFVASTRTPLEEARTIEQSDTETTAKEPGWYTFERKTEYHRYNFIFRFYCVIDPAPKLKPELRFEANGGEEITPGEYYRYTYDGEEHYPLAYGWYDGKRLDAADSPRELLEGCDSISDPSISSVAPKDIGIYIVWFYIGKYEEDPEGNIYDSVRKIITIEIVE